MRHGAYAYSEKLKTQIVKSRRNNTEMGLVGRGSTGHWTWGCGCHRTYSKILIKQKNWEIKDRTTRKEFEKQREMLGIQGIVEKGVGAESVFLGKPELAAVPLHVPSCWCGHLRFFRSLLQALSPLQYFEWRRCRFCRKHYFVHYHKECILFLVWKCVTIWH